MKNTENAIFAKYCKKHLKSIIIYIWLSSIISSGINIIQAKLMAFIVAEATVGNINKVFQVSILTLLIYLVQSLAFSIFNVINEKKKQLAIQKCKMNFYQAFLNQPLHILHSEKHGNNIEKLNDDFNVFINYYLSTRTNIITNLIVAALYGIFIFFLSRVASICLLFIAFLQIIIPIIISKYLEINYENTRKIESSITDFYINSYKGIETIKIFGLSKLFLSKLEKLHKQYLKIGNIAEVTCSAQNSLEALVSNILTYGTYGIIGILILYKLLTLESGIQIIVLSGSFYAACNILFKTYPEYKVSKIAIKRLLPWFSFIAEKADERIYSLKRISIKNLSYRIDNHDVLSNISMVFEQHKVSLIIGKNGAGKSTLLKIIIGLIQDYEGTILFEKQDVKNISTKDLNKVLTYIPQDDTYFLMSVNELFDSMENIDIDKCRKISSTFGLSQELLNQNLSDLSGGEIKKVYLSIAFSAMSDFILLDEPSNSLDKASKNILINLIKETNKGVIVVSHDPIFQSIADKQYNLGEKV